MSATPSMPTQAILDTPMEHKPSVAERIDDMLKGVVDKIISKGQVYALVDYIALLQRQSAKAGGRRKALKKHHTSYQAILMENRWLRSVLDDHRKLDGKDYRQHARDTLWAEFKKVSRVDMAQVDNAAQMQVDKLAAFILKEVPGEPSANEGAVDTVIRLLRNKTISQTDLLEWATGGVVKIADLEGKVIFEGTWEELKDKLGAWDS